MSGNNVEVVERATPEEIAQWKAEDAAAREKELWNPRPERQLSYEEYAKAREICDALFGRDREI